MSASFVFSSSLVMADSTGLTGGVWGMATGNHLAESSREARKPDEISLWSPLDFGALAGPLTSSMTSVPSLICRVFPLSAQLVTPTLPRYPVLLIVRIRTMYIQTRPSQCLSAWPEVRATHATCTTVGTDTSPSPACGGGRPPIALIGRICWLTTFCAAML